MNDPLIWLAALAWGVTSGTVFYGATVLTERRQDRHRRAHLRNRLQLRA